MDITPHFTREELECRCGCGRMNVQPVAVNRLEAMRRGLGRAIRPTSVCRCPKHNKAVGGKWDSAHLGGWGFDLAVEGSRDRYQKREAAREAGFNRIGHGATFMHVDCDPSKPQDVEWLYS